MHAARRAAAAGLSADQAPARRLSQLRAAELAAVGVQNVEIEESAQRVLILKPDAQRLDGCRLAAQRVKPLGTCRRGDTLPEPAQFVADHT